MHRLSRGQALPIALAGIVFITTMTLVLFNTSQITAQKMRLANAADAAVYSGLVWEARVLNYEASLNRAMVANQVTIGQLVSIMSWMQYLEISARNIDATLGWVPVLKPYTHEFYQGSIQANTYVTRVARPAVGAIDRLITVLSNAQAAVHAAGAAAAGDTVLEVVRLNDARFEVSWPSGLGLAENAVAWSRFTKEYNDLPGQRRQAEVIRDSLDDHDRGFDGFTHDRGWSKTMADVGIFQVRLVKGGATRLIEATTQDEFGNTSTAWEWKGKDTLSIHTRHWGCSWKGCGWRHDEMPIGWGGALYSTTGQEVESCAQEGDAFSGSRCDAWSRNRWADRLADTEMQNVNGTYGGIRAYRDVSDLSTDDTSNRLRMGLEVILPKDKARTSSGIPGVGSARNGAVGASGLEQGLYYYEDRAAGDVYSAVSAGEVYFERPELRKDGRIEYASLFNPYWDVRLVNPDRERMIAWGVRALDGLLNGGGGGSVPGS